MRCHVRHRARGRVCANSGNTWRPRIWASALHVGGSVGTLVSFCIVTRLEGEVCLHTRCFQTFIQGGFVPRSESREPQEGSRRPLVPERCGLRLHQPGSLPAFRPQDPDLPREWDSPWGSRGTWTHWYLGFAGRGTRGQQVYPKRGLASNALEQTLDTTETLRSQESLSFFLGGGGGNI